MRESVQALIRPLVRELAPYVPGEQPRIARLIKLNTNENPYPPARPVLRAIKAATDARLRLYPDPAAEALRERLARFHRCDPENICVGNGSDEILALATRAFVEPAGGAGVPEGSRSVVQFFTPSYSLYPVLAAAHGARANVVPLREDFSMPSLEELREERRWDFKAALTFITTPNAPSGRGCATRELERLCRAQDGVTLLDEAYADFAEENALELALKIPGVLVARTFSKGYSLCFLRVGYCVGHPELIAALDKIRDSYNVNGLGQAAALATLENLGYYKKNFGRIKRTRERLAADLRAIGFHVLPSQANFIFARPPKRSAEQWLRWLRDRRILVRWFPAETTRPFLRITIGTDREAKALSRAAREILRGEAARGSD